MTKKMGKAALLFFAGAMALTSCNRETDLYNPYATMEDYSNNWNDKFGNVDENQDWNMAEKVTATFNLSEITNDECSVNIYSKSPLKEGCILLQSATMNASTWGMAASMTCSSSSFSPSNTIELSARYARTPRPRQRADISGRSASEKFTPLRARILKAPRPKYTASAPASSAA